MQLPKNLGPQTATELAQRAIKKGKLSTESVGEVTPGKAAERVSRVVEKTIDAFAREGRLPITGVARAELKARVTDAIADKLRPLYGTSAAASAIQTLARTQLGAAVSADARASMISAGVREDSIWRSAPASIAANLGVVADPATAVASAAQHDLGLRHGALTRQLPARVLALVGAPLAARAREAAAGAIAALADAAAGARTDLRTTPQDRGMKQATGDYLAAAGAELKRARDTLAAGGTPRWGELPLAQQLIDAHKLRVPGASNDAERVQALVDGVFGVAVAGGFLTRLSGGLRGHGADSTHDPFGMLESTTVPADRMQRAKAIEADGYEHQGRGDFVTDKLTHLTRMLDDNSRPTDPNAFVLQLEALTAYNSPLARNGAAVVLASRDIREAMMQMLSARTPEEAPEAAALADRIMGLAAFPRVVFAEPLPA